MKTVDQIVVIDDDPTNNTICKIVLKKSLPDVAVISFENPVEALKFFSSLVHKKDRNTVIFLDINMPEMSGWEFLEACDALSLLQLETIKVFILSSSINADDKERALSDPRIIEFLEKPLTLSTVKRIFELRA